MANVEPYENIFLTSIKFKISSLFELFKKD